MKLLQKEKDGKMVLKLNVSPIFANMLRRQILERVPTMAIKEVEIRANSSALYDEQLAHRLGLIPLKTDLKSYEIPPEDMEEGVKALKYALSLTLQAKGPCTVYASEIKSKDPKVIPVFPKTPIVKLLKGQELEFEATATLGTGDKHMKFAPGIAFYSNVYEFKQKKDIENAEEVVKNTPAGLFKAQGKKLVPQDESKGHLWDSCLSLVPEGSVEITQVPNEIVFTLESWGQLSCEEIMVEACDSFLNDLDEFEKSLK